MTDTESGYALPQAPPNFKPRENPPDAKTYGSEDLVRIGTEDPLMNFEAQDGRRYSTRNNMTWMPAAEAEKLAAAVPGVSIIRPTSRGIGPGARFNSRWRHEWDMECNCKRDDCTNPWEKKNDVDHS